MNKPESILTDAEMHALICGNPFTLGLSIARLKDFIRQVEKAVVDKLHEQEPLAWYVNNDITFDQQTADSWKKNLFIVKPLYENPSSSIVSDKTACISENAESEDQDIELLKQALDTMIRAAHPAYAQEDLLREKLIKARDTAFKALKTNRLNAKERHRTAKNHIPNVGKMVVPHGYRLVSLADIDTAIQRANVFDDGGDGAAPESARSCIEILKGMISSKAADSLAPKKEVVHDRHTGRESLYTPPVGESLYSIAQARKESFSLALSVDTKEAQALLQSYLDSLDGWQLVPKQATNDMYLSFCHVRNDIEPDEFREAYRAVLEASPKYAGDSNE